MSRRADASTRGPEGDPSPSQDPAILFRAVVETAHEGIWIMDPEGRTVYVNDRMTELLDYSQEEMLGLHLEQFVAGEDRATALLQAARQRQDDAPQSQELVLLTRAHDERTVLMRCSPLPGEDDAGPGTLAMVTDITDRIRTEAEVQRIHAALSAELEERIERRTEELARANRNLAASVAELEGFTYSVSHDLRGPLRALDGFSQAVLEDYGDMLDATGREYLQRVRAAAQRMGTLMDDLLSLSRIGKGGLRRNPVDLAEMARDVADELQQMDPERNVEFRVHPELSVTGDANLLRIVLENLLGNAWKFTRTEPRPRIEVGRQAAAGEDSVFVKDNGVGFDPAYREKLFTPFQRLHPNAEFEGNGIGLATVHRIIRKHGGRVWAESESGSGASFHFSLPRGDGGKVPAGVPASDRVPAPDGAPTEGQEP
jgi:PAS domain S-box-containing protein